MRAILSLSLKYHCSAGVIVPGGEARGNCVLQTIPDSESGILIIEEAGLRRLRRHFPGPQTVRTVWSRTFSDHCRRLGAEKLPTRRPDDEYNDAVDTGGDTFGYSCVTRG